MGVNPLLLSPSWVAEQPNAPLGLLLHNGDDRAACCYSLTMDGASRGLCVQGLGPRAAVHL